MVNHRAIHVGQLPPAYRFLRDAAMAAEFCAVGVIGAGPVPRFAVDEFERWLGNVPETVVPYLRSWSAVRANCAHSDLMSRTVTIAVMALPYGDGAVNGGVWTHISALARGRDYHKTVKQKLKRVAVEVTSRFPGARTRAVVDSAPVMERSLAVMAGLGQVGRSGMLLVPGVGPRVVLGELLMSGVPPVAAWREWADGCLDDHRWVCGDCTRCVDSCPTGALFGNGRLEPARCISYQTIEPGGADADDCLSDMLYGCDVCTQVCPFHKTMAPGKIEPPLQPVLANDLVELGQMSTRELARRLQGTAMTRPGAASLQARARRIVIRQQGKTQTEGD